MSVLQSRSIVMESNETVGKNIANIQNEDQDEKVQTDNSVLRSILQDWDDLNKDFTQLQVFYS